MQRVTDVKKQEAGEDPTREKEGGKEEERADEREDVREGRYAREEKKKKKRRSLNPPTHG